MSTATVNIEAQNTFARLLAAENLTIRHKKVKTASFDPINRVLTRPILKDMSPDLYILLDAHEAFHALYTYVIEDGKRVNIDLKTAAMKIDKKNWQIAADYVNIGCDARIERMGKTRYPGLKQSFIRGYIELVDRNFFGTKNRDINTFPFVDRANIFFKAGAAMGIQFSADEQKLIEKMAHTLTFEDVIDVMREVYEYCKDERDQAEEPQTGEPGEQGESGSGSGESESDDSESNSGKPDSSEADSDASGSESGDEAKPDESKTGSKSGDKSKKDSKPGKKSKNDSKSKPKSKNDSTTDADAGDEAGDESDEAAGDDEEGEESSTSGKDSKGDESGDSEAESGDDAESGDHEGDSDDDSGDGSESGSEAGDEADSDDSESGQESGSEPAGKPGETPGEDSDGKPESGDSEGSEGSEEGTESKKPGEDGDSDAPSTDHTRHTERKGKSGKPKNTAPVEAETQSTFDELIQTLNDDSAAQIEYLTVPTPNLDRIIVDYKIVHKDLRTHLDKQAATVLIDAEARYKAFRNDSKKVVAYIGKEFEMRKKADEFSRTLQSKSGVIDPVRQNQYMFTDDIFQTLDIVPEGKNHGLVMVVDWSTSMRPQMTATMEQLLNLVFFCRNLRVPFEVYSFTTGGMEQSFDESAPGSLNFTSNFKMRNYFSSRMTAMEFTAACVNLFALMETNGSFGNNAPYTDKLIDSTPLDEAIVATGEIVRRFRKATGVQICNTVFLTDGGANGCHGFRNSAGHNSSFDGRTQYVISDKNTKKDYKWVSDGCTEILLKMLGDTMGINVLGFFVAPEGYHYNAYILNKFYKIEEEDDPRLTVLNTQFENDGFLICKEYGYNELYIIKGGSKLRVKPLEAGDSTTPVAVPSTLIQNRVVLKSFVTQIA